MTHRLAQLCPAKTGGLALPPATFSAAGEHEYTAALPAGAGEIEFTADKVVGRTKSENRELGLVYLCARIVKGAP